MIIRVVYRLPFYNIKKENITMLAHKDIEKIRRMYYEQHYTVTEITRILKISRNTCYRYLRFVNFNAYVKENKKTHYLD